MGETRSLCVVDNFVFESIGGCVLDILCLDTLICKGQSSYRTNNSVMLNEWEPRLIASCPTVQFPFAPLIFCFY